MEISKEIEIDMGHRVPNHNSKCRNFHGHRYKIRATIDGEVHTEKGKSNEGMVADFSDLKRLMMEVIDAKYDHSMTIHRSDYNDYWFFLKHDDLMKINILEEIPTAENLAKLWAIELGTELYKLGLILTELTVWETPASTATWRLPK